MTMSRCSNEDMFSRVHSVKSFISFFMSPPFFPYVQRLFQATGEFTAH